MLKLTHIRQAIGAPIPTFVITVNYPEWFGPTQLGFIENVYQIIPTEKTQIGYKAFPVYCFEPDAPKVKDLLGNTWEYAEVNKMICISTGKNGGLEGSSCVSFQQFEKTYMEWNTYFAEKETPQLKRA